jgi:hypothetical protein
MSTTWEQLEGAVLTLARSGTIKERLADAFRNHLAQLNADDLPDAQPARAQPETLAAPAAELQVTANRINGAHSSVLNGAHNDVLNGAIALNGALKGKRKAPKRVPQIISLYAAEA